MVNAAEREIVGCDDNDCLALQSTMLYIVMYGKNVRL